MKLNLFAASVLLAATPVFAQGPAPDVHGPQPGPMAHGFGGGFGPMRQPVTNAPYSATFTNTSTEKLQDGTTLTHTVTRVAARDSLGRTREEITMPGHGPDAKPHTMIVIFDPVAKTITNLNTEKKTAMVHSIPEPRGPRGGRGFGGERGPGRRGPDGPPPAGEQPPVASKDGEGPHGPRGDRERNVVVTDLGSKNIAGVVATGKRITRTVPANTMGNSAPIISTREEWISPDLKIELSRSDVNPFRGTDMLAVSGLTKAEPAPALFKLPEGYTVEAAPERAFGRRGPGGMRHGSDVPPPPPGM